MNFTCRNMYNRSISSMPNWDIIPSVIHRAVNAGKCLTRNGRGLTEKRKLRNFLRKMIGQTIETVNTEYSLNNNFTLLSTLVTGPIRKRRIACHDHISLTTPVRHTDVIFTYFSDKKNKTASFTEVKRELQEPHHSSLHRR